MNERAPFTDSTAFRLGETAGEQRLAGAEDAAEAALALATQARLSLRIFTHDLDRRLYSNEAFYSAVSALARAGRRTFVRILIQDPSRAVQDDHRLIGLIQHLPTHIGIRRVGADWRDERFAFQIADEQGVLWRPAADRFEGSVDFHAGPRARELRKWFDDVWEHSEPDPEFRRLRL
ncbi:MAG: hypothetical protein U5K73_07380 [Halofilum sp. (in: g-proteobacteria)]|nr:hypothetical protein [Halofilum sp. (in: g-proteobacteria)]